MQRAAAEQMLAAQLACTQGGAFDGAGPDALPDGGAGEHTARAFQLLRALHPVGPNAVSPVRIPAIISSNHWLPVFKH